jgi:hypothetical protein
MCQTIDYRITGNISKNFTRKKYICLSIFVADHTLVIQVEIVNIIKQKKYT